MVWWWSRHGRSLRFWTHCSKLEPRVTMPLILPPTADWSVITAVRLEVYHGIGIRGGTNLDVVISIGIVG